MSDLGGLSVSFLAGTLGQGGAERQLFYIVKALVESGARPRVLSLSTGDFWEARMRSLGVPVVWIGRRRSRLARFAAAIAAGRTDRPDFFQSQHFYMNLYAVAAARALGAAEIGAIRCDVRSEVADTGRVIGPLSLRLPRIVAANSRAAIRNAVALGVPENRLRLLPNVVDTDYFAARSPSPNGHIRLLAVGRRGRQKRFDRLLSVVAAVRKRTKRPMRTVLVTTGREERDVLERQATSLGLDADALEFRESVADMAPVYRSADIFLLTSDWEGTPNVVLEAMSSATPVVATRVGGVPDIVRDGDTGYLADPDDTARFADAVVSLIEDDQARAAMGCRARQSIADGHSVRQLPAILSDFYGAART